VTVWCAVCLDENDSAGLKSWTQRKPVSSKPACQTVTYIEVHIPDVVLINWFSWWWAQLCSKNVDNLNKYDSNKLTNKMQQFHKFITDVYVWLNMFRAFLCPSSEAFNCISSLWFYRRSVVVAALLVVVWPEHDQQHCYHHAPTVKPEAANAVESSWWWEWKRPKHVEPHINVSNKLEKLLHLVG